MLVGALTGALALIASTHAAFVSVVPFCLALAVAAILLGNRLPALVARWIPGGASGVLTGTLLFLCGVYGGYFGAGLGFMLLAVLTLAGVPDMQEANAQKNLLAFFINSTAVVPLALSGLVDWLAAAGVLAGGLVGGYFGASLTRLVPARPFRWAVGLVGVALTVSFLAR